VAGGVAQASLPCIVISRMCIEVCCAEGVSLDTWLGECWVRQALLLRYFSEPLKCLLCCEALKGLSEALPPCLFFSHCFMVLGRALGSAVAAKYCLGGVCPRGMSWLCGRYDGGFRLIPQWGRLRPDAVGRDPSPSSVHSSPGSLLFWLLLRST